MQIMLDIPETVTFVRGGHEMELALATLPPAMLAELVAHGLTQKVGDAAAGKQGNEALAAMQKVHDALKAGNWGVRRATGGGDGLSDLERMIVQVADEAIPVKVWKAKIDGWAGMTTAERRVAKWGLLQKSPRLADLQERAEARMAEDLGDLF